MIALDGVVFRRLETVSMKPPSPPPPKLTQAELARQAREEAEATALRANLARRKAQSRAKPITVKDDPECP